MSITSRKNGVEVSRPLALLTAALATSTEPIPAGLADLSEGEWAEFTRLAISRHRVAGVIAPKIRDCEAPASALAELDAEIRSNRMRATALMHALSSILERFERIGVSPVVLKGLPLSERLYGSPDIRDAGDIDLLVPEGAVGACGAALQGLGFVVDSGHELRGRILESRAVRVECNDLAFIHPALGIAVELHWRSHHFRGWPDMVATLEHVVVQSSGIGDVRVPSDSANAILLSLHGGLHMWTQMKWVADIARLAKRRGIDGLSEDFELARRTGSFRAVAVAFRLADAIIGCELPPALAGPKLGSLERAMLSTATAEELRTERLVFRLRTYLTALRLSQGVRQKLEVVRYGAWRPVRLIAEDLRRR